MSQKSLEKRTMKKSSDQGLEDAINSYRPKQEEIVVYLSRAGYSRIPRESIKLAEKYMREEVGLNFRFELCDKKNIPYDSLDHRCNLLIKELDKDDLETMVSDEVTKICDGTSSDMYGFLSKNDMQNIRRIMREGNPGAKRQFKDWLEGRVLSYFNKKVLGMALVKNGEVILIKKNLKNRKYLYDKHKKEKEEDYELYREKLKGRRTRLIKMRADDLLHELGHVAGLWHTFQYKNDYLVDYTRKIPNLMSYRAPRRGEYGFKLTEKQMEMFRSYFQGGEIYQLMRKHRFSFNVYCSDIEKQTNYKDQELKEKEIRYIIEQMQLNTFGIKYFLK